MAFFSAGIVLLSSIWFGWPLAVTLLALFIVAMAAGLVQLSFKCRNCGVGYFFDPAISGWNFTGANMLKPVQSRCPKCGADR